MPAAVQVGAAGHQQGHRATVDLFQLRDVEVEALTLSHDRE